MDKQEYTNRLRSEVRSRMYNLLGNNMMFELQDKDHILEPGKISVSEEKRILRESFEWFLEKFYEDTTD